MAGSSKKRAVWGSDEEKKLIEIWAELLQKTNGKMVTRKKKEALATAQLNDYVSKTLEKPVIFLEKEVRNKIDSMLKKGKQIYQTKRKTGQAVDADNEIELDMEAAEGAWPNFKTFYIHFKDHPSLGPGSVEDSLSAPVADAEVDKKPSITVHGDSSDSDSDDDEEEKKSSKPPPAKKPPALVPSRVPASTRANEKFIYQFEKIQEKTQKSIVEHEKQLQTQSHAFQAQLEQDRLKFEAELTQKMQQQSQQFQLIMLQQTQLFQAQLMKKLFEKED